MQREVIFEKLREILSEAVAGSSASADNVKESSDLINELGLSSVNMLYMMLSIEECFSIRFDDTTTVNSFCTVGSVIDYIEQRAE